MTDSSMSRELIRIRSAIWRKEKDSVYALIEIASNLSGTNGILSVVISSALEKIRELVGSDRFEEAYDLADAVHALPEIASTPDRDMMAYWNDFIVPYREKWHSDFFEAFREEIPRL